MCHVSSMRAPIWYRFSGWKSGPYCTHNHIVTTNLRLHETYTATPGRSGDECLIHQLVCRHTVLGWYGAKTPTPPPSEPRRPAAYLALRRRTRRRTTSCHSGRREVHQQCSCGRCNASLSVLKLGPSKEAPLLDPALCSVHRGSVRRRVRVHKFGDGWCPCAGHQI